MIAIRDGLEVRQGARSAIDSAECRFELSPLELAFYERNGWVGPFDAFSPKEARGAADVCVASTELFASPHEFACEDPDALLARKPWFKSMHSVLSVVHDICVDRALTGRVSSLLGPEILVWGSTAKVSVPGLRHRWHVDIEHATWRGISVFLGLAGLCRETSLKVVSGSHLFKASPQSLGLDDDEAILAYCADNNYDTRIDMIPVADGQFFLFHGNLWHGSHNTKRHSRVALIIQYCAPEEQPRIPVTWDAPVRWSVHKPPCAVALGGGLENGNLIVGRPRDGLLAVGFE